MRPTGEGVEAGTPEDLLDEALTESFPASDPPATGDFVRHAARPGPGSEPGSGSAPAPHGRRILVLYGSYRTGRAGIRLADYCVRRFRERGADAELVDAKAVGLPMLDRMYKEYGPGAAPPAMEALAGKIVAADAFVFVAGEYNWGVQPGLKNLTDHFLEEWFWRPAGLATYSGGRFAGVRAGLAWRSTLSEMGMAVIPSVLSVGPIAAALDELGHPTGDGGAALERSFGRFADELVWWADAAAAQRAANAPPY